MGAENEAKWKEHCKQTPDEPRRLGLGTAEAVRDFKAVLAKHFGISDTQSYSKVTITLDYQDSFLFVNQEIQFIALGE